MEKENLANQVKVLIVARKIRFLGLAILLGAMVVYAMGLFVSSQNKNPHLEYLNIATFVFCLLLCFASVPLKSMLMKKVTADKFESKYFNAHVMPFALCDLGGLLCITTSLFVNQNVVYASLGFFIMIGAIIYNFPKYDDHKNFQ